MTWSQHLAALYWPQRQEREQLRAPQLERQSVLSQEQICAHADPSPRTAHAHSLQGIMPLRSPGLGPLSLGTSGTCPWLPRFSCIWCFSSFDGCSRRWQGAVLQEVAGCSAKGPGPVQGQGLVPRLAGLGELVQELLPSTSLLIWELSGAGLGCHSCFSAFFFFQCC